MSVSPNRSESLEFLRNMRSQRWRRGYPIHTAYAPPVRPPSVRGVRSARHRRTRGRSNCCHRERCPLRAPPSTNARVPRCRAPRESLRPPARPHSFPPAVYSEIVTRVLCGCDPPGAHRSYRLAWLVGHAHGWPHQLGTPQDSHVFTVLFMIPGSQGGPRNARDGFLKRTFNQNPEAPDLCLFRPD